jgi:hypothetical protein
MNKLLLLAAMALLSTVHQASACDMGAITAYVTGTVVADGCGSANCAVERPDTPAIPQTPEDCTSQGCATPTLPVQKLACDSSNCAIQQPSDEPITTQEPKDCQGNCATPALPAKPVVVADCPGGC